MSKVRFHVVVSGLVQGVFYRSSTRDKAKYFGLTGWVRNLPNGDVEAVIEGESAAAREMLKWMREGPPGAAVESIEVKEEPYMGEFNCFSIKYF